METVIIILVIALIVFLVLREFWCWYWKINKVIAILQEQNSLLRQYLGANVITGAGNPQVNSDVLNPNEFIISKKTSLFAGPGETYRFVYEIQSGEVVLEKGSEGIWTYVATKNGKEGWYKKTEN